MNSDRLLRLPEVMAKVALRQTAIFEKVRTGTFPAPIRLSSHASRWSEREVDAWIADRLAERESAE